MRNQPYIPKARSLDPLITPEASGDAGHAAAHAPAAADGDGVKVNFTSRMPAALRLRFKTACVTRGVSMEDAIRDAVTAWLDA